MPSNRTRTTLVSYQLAGSGQMPAQASSLLGLSETKAWLEERLGPLVKFEVIEPEAPGFRGGRVTHGAKAAGSASYRVGVEVGGLLGVAGRIPVYVVDTGMYPRRTKTCQAISIMGAADGAPLGRRQVAR